MKRLNRILLIISIPFFVATYGFTQCEDRYKTEVFDAVNIDTIVYSDVTGFEMNIYQPEGDMYSERPLLIFGHSGAFYTGDKNSAFMESICTKFAKRGYVTASIQYSLAESQDFITDSLYMKDIIVKAVGDAKAAVRYFRKSALEENQYRIDDDQIWIGGNSAGGMLSLQMAFLDEQDIVPAYLQEIINANGGYEGNRGNEGYSSHVNGVINLAGAILEIDWVNEGETESLVSCHGSADDIVDIQCNDLFWNFGPFADLDLLKFYGSAIIQNKATEIGLDNSLLVFEDLNHVPWLNEGEEQDEAIEHIQNFLHERIDCNIILASEEVSNSTFTIYPNPTEQSFSIFTDQTIKIDQIFLLDMNGNMIEEIPNNLREHTISYHSLKSGLYFIQIISGEYSTIEKLVLR